MRVGLFLDVTVHRALKHAVADVDGGTQSSITEAALRAYLPTISQAAGRALRST